MSCLPGIGKSPRQKPAFPPSPPVNSSRQPHSIHNATFPLILFDISNFRTRISENYGHVVVYAYKKRRIHYKVTKSELCFMVYFTAPSIPAIAYTIVRQNDW
jgi:hypothetical protein